MTLETRCLPCACIPAPVPGETMGEAPGPLGPPIGDFIIPGGPPPGSGPGAAPGISAMDHQSSMSDMQIGMTQMDLGQAPNTILSPPPPRPTIPLNSTSNLNPREESYQGDTREGKGKKIRRNRRTLRKSRPAHRAGVVQGSSGFLPAGAFFLSSTKKERRHLDAALASLAVWRLRANRNALSGSAGLGIYRRPRRLCRLPRRLWTFESVYVMISSPLLFPARCGQNSPKNDR